MSLFTFAPDHWSLQEAKARFSELVRRSQREGPQHVTLHGREAVVVIDAAQYRSLAGERSGQQLIEALQASPYPELELVPPRAQMSVRDVSL